MSVTMKDLSKKLGVTEASISYALTNRGRLATETRQRIIELARELNYHPHEIARSLATKKANAIGIGLYDFDYITMHYFSSIISGIGRWVGMKGYDLRFVTTNKDIEERNLRSYFLRRVEERGMDGIIIVDHVVSDKDILALNTKEIPLVLVDRDIETEQMNCVLIDHEGGIFEATKHLIERGHERIAIILGPLDYDDNRQKLKGYQKALEEHQIGYDENMVISRVDYDIEQFPEVVNVLKMEKPATAFIVHSDFRAMSVMRKVMERGINIPDDVAVVGFEDSPLAASSYPMLTTVGVRLQEVGEAAANILFKLLEREKPEKRKVMIKTKLIVRQSS